MVTILTLNLVNLFTKLLEKHNPYIVYCINKIKRITFFINKNLEDMS